jgi:hypothetical protein
MNDCKPEEIRELPVGYRALPELAPPDVFDPVIEAYKKDVDRTLLRENLNLTLEKRFRKFQSFMRFVHGIRGAATRRDGTPGKDG